VEPADPGRISHFLDARWGPKRFWDPWRSYFIRLSRKLSTRDSLLVRKFESQMCVTFLSFVERNVSHRAMRFASQILFLLEKLRGYDAAPA
jgi:hypothetical protein